MTKCLVHARTHRITGVFDGCIDEHDRAPATLMVDGIQCFGTVPRASIIESQRDQTLDGRAFMVTMRGHVHLCRCVYTKAELVKARNEAQALLKGLRIE